MLHLVEPIRPDDSEALAVINAVREGDDPLRLAAVKRYDILDTPPEDAFDRITALAAELFDVPVAFIGIVDSDRVWLKSRYGFDVGEFSRTSEPFVSTILSRAPWMSRRARWRWNWMWRTRMGVCRRERSVRCVGRFTVQRHRCSCPAAASRPRPIARLLFACAAARRNGST